MTDLPALCAMLKMLTNVTPSAVAYVDDHGVIAHLEMSRRTERSLRNYQGMNVIRLLKLLLGPAAKDICDAYQACATSWEPIQILRFQYETVRNMTEFFDWRFVPVPESRGVVICVSDVSESVCIEQEFAAISHQNESANRELHAAMSQLDFRLMDLDQAHKKLATLYRITSIVQRTVDEQEVLEEIVVGITTELGYASAAVLLLEEESQELVAKATRGYMPNLRIPYGKGITWRAMLSRELVYIPDVTKESAYIPAGTNGLSEVAIPLIFADKVIGVLDIESAEDRPIQPYDLNLLRSLAGQVALTIVHAQHVTKVEVQAITDGLTGLYNYRYFLDLLDREFKRAVRYNRPLALLMLDIDYFKRYNDTHGHPLGNEVLRQVAEIIKQVCRDVDFVVRYGGEEFSVLIPETGRIEASIVAERIRAKVAEFPFAGRQTQPGGALTISIGVAAYPEDAYSDKELLEHADTALYLAKRSTRNCVINFPKPLPAEGRL